MRRGKISPVLACKEFGALLGADNLHRKALLAALLCSALSLSYACEPNDSSRVALFKGSPQKVTPFCIQAHCLKRGQIYYENIMPEFPREELPSAEAGIPSVLAFISELSGHKSIEAWCAALKSRAELKRPLFCDKPAVVQRAVSRGIQPFDHLIISTNGEGRFFYQVLARKRDRCLPGHVTVGWSSATSRIEVENPTDLVGYFFKRRDCKMVQPPAESYDPAYRRK